MTDELEDKSVVLYVELEDDDSMPFSCLVCLIIKK